MEYQGYHFLNLIIWHLAWVLKQCCWRYVGLRQNRLVPQLILFENSNWNPTRAIEQFTSQNNSRHRTGHVFIHFCEITCLYIFKHEIHLQYHSLLAPLLDWPVSLSRLRRVERSKALEGLLLNINWLQPGRVGYTTLSYQRTWIFL